MRISDWSSDVCSSDLEIPVNIYDLGLIYNVEIDEGHVMVTMTLTTPHCPVAESMPGEVELRVGAVPGVGDADVNLVGDPPWSSSEARRVGQACVRTCRSWWTPLR